MRGCFRGFSSVSTPSAIALTVVQSEKGLMDILDAVRSKNVKTGTTVKHENKNLLICLSRIQILWIDRQQGNL